MSVNGRGVAGVGVSEVTQMVNNSRPTVTLDVEFEVADSVVPSSGTFAVKLAKRHSGLGITITSKYFFSIEFFLFINTKYSKMKIYMTFKYFLKTSLEYI